MKPLLFRLIPFLFLLAIFYFLGREFADNFDHIKNFTFDFRISLLTVSSLAYVLSLGIFSAGWFFLLRFLHFPISLFKTACYFFITQPAKYIPGKIWIGVTRMKFCKPHSIPNSVTLLTTGIEAVLEILAGAYLSVFLFIKPEFIEGYTAPILAAVVIIGVLLLIPEVFYFFVNLFFRIIRKPAVPREKWCSFQQLLLLQIIYLGGVAMLSASQVLFLQSFAPVSSEHFPLLFSVAAFSYIASIAALFAPSGLGVREGIWYLALKKISSPESALLYSFISRLWMVILDAILLLFAIPALWLKRRFEK